jgi:UV DNA damage endonuclease
MSAPPSNSETRIYLGLMCINNTLRKKDIYCSRTCIRKNFTVEKAMNLAYQNISDIKELIKWNVKNNIHSLRISSDLLPHFTDSETQEYNLDFAYELLQEIGIYAKEVGHRLTFHPGQFCQVGAKDSSIFGKTVLDLDMHASIFDIMELDENSIVNIHLGGMYGDKEASKRRWIDQFDDLPSCVKARLTIENDEKCYSTRDCLDVAYQVGIPVIFDNHHYYCYSQLHPNEEQEEIDNLLEEIVDTWGDREVLCHISEQKEGSKVGAHSDYISRLPDYYLSFPETFGRNLYLDIEAKGKEEAILKLYKTHPELIKK